MFKKLKLRCLEVRNSKMNNCGEQVKEFSHNALSPYRPHALTPLAKAAFTMAEILLSLTIIGVVAAITLPSLTGNINERTWNTQRKALYSRLSQAIALIDGVRNYGNISVSSYSAEGAFLDKKFSSDNAAEAFITAGLGKVMKINNVCDYSHLGDCGLPDKFIRFGGGEKISLSSFTNIAGLNSKYTGATVDANNDAYMTNSGTANLLGAVDTKAAAFETGNGESILVHYNPICREAMTWGEFTLQEPLAAVCANFIYDLNGKKGPNTIGKDMGFMTMFYPSDSLLVAPLPHQKNLSGTYTQQEATVACRNAGDNSRLPTIEELASINMNKNIMDAGYITSALWSATRYEKDNNQAYILTPTYDQIHYGSLSISINARCVERN